MKVDNSLRIQLTSGYEPELANAEGITFDTFYPGGLFGSLIFLVRRDVSQAWGLKAHQMIRATNGQDTVWEGEVTRLVYIPGLGFRVECLGYWASIFEGRGWRKPWADNRMSEDVWRYDTARSGAEKCTVDRQNRIRFTPKAVAWTTNQVARVYYDAPTGEHIKRVTFNYDLQESTQQWQLRLVDVTNSVVEWSVTASGTGSADETITNPTTCARVGLDLIADANQTPASDGTIYGAVTDVVLYTETGAIDLTEIAKDIRAHESDLSASETLIGSNTYSLVPFVSEGESLADCLLRAAGFGDADGDAWTASVVESANGTDGKPVLRVEQQPALTAYDYALRLGEENVLPGVEFTQDVSEVRNWIEVHYRDANGRDAYITPDDDATLKDDASIAAYGERHERLDVDTTSATTATAFGVRYLGQYKNPRWQATGGITVKGYIRAAGGGIIPACRIRAGKRLKVENFMNDLSGSGLTLLISGTTYNADGETLRMDVGVPDYLAVQIARMEKA